jgi:hypothetical protein
MSDKPINLSIVLGGGQKGNATDELLAKAQAEWDNHIKIIAFDAKRKKALYDSYITAGFTPEQALQLIK